MSFAPALGCLLLAYASVTAGDEPANNIEVASIYLHKSVPDYSPAYTTLTLIVKQPGKRIIGIDLDGSKLARMTDDKLTDMIGKQEQRKMLWNSASVFEGGSRIAFDVRSTILPTRGSTKLELKGTVKLRIGNEEKVLQENGVTLNAGTKLKLGPFEVSPSEQPVGRFNEKPVADNRTYVKLSYTSNILKEIQFRNAEGKVLHSSPVGSTTSGSKENVSITRDYAIQGKIEQGTVVITYFSTTQTVEVPFDLSVGLGF